MNYKHKLYSQLNSMILKLYSSLARALYKNILLAHLNYTFYNPSIISERAYIKITNLQQEQFVPEIWISH